MLSPTALRSVAAPPPNSYSLSLAMPPSVSASVSASVPLHGPCFELRVRVRTRGIGMDGPAASSEEADALDGLWWSLRGAGALGSVWDDALRVRCSSARRIAAER